MTRKQNWLDLFEPAGATRISISMRAVRKRGQIFLLLPNNGQLAAKSLSLYPAQKFPARIAKLLLRTALRANFPCGLEKLEFGISPDDPLINFLSSLAGTKGIPPFAILAGNPNVEGQRFIILLFNAAGNPIVVVKAGINDAAKILITKEELFLKSVPNHFRGIPAVCDSFDFKNIRAFALDFFSGNSPKPSEWTQPFLLLNSWLNENAFISLEQSPLWQNLKNKTVSQLFSELAKRLAKRSFRPTISHGDFAPWNIKSDGDVWMVLDWERGELVGIPGWDCFHFIVQPAILVEHLGTVGLIERIEIFLKSAEFLDYAKRAQISSMERELFLAYLIYQIEVIQPAEGKQATEDLLVALSAKWLRA